MIIFDDFEKGSCEIFSSTECEMYQEIIATKGGGNLKKDVTNTYGFTTDEKLLTGVNSSLPSQGIEFFNIFHEGP
jgi:hypothetical protein